MLMYTSVGTLQELFVRCCWTGLFLHSGGGGSLAHNTYAVLYDIVDACAHAYNYLQEFEGGIGFDIKTVKLW